MHPIVEREAGILASYAMHSVNSAGRQHPESDHPYRGPFQRDRDRILHSAAFRRLSGKTQVFTGLDDYHRTRLTHTMEVASIARTIGRALRLNEDLIEALALLHDIGHPPFGHAGEEVLDEFLKDQGGFSHNEYALTLVCELERRYPRFPGINLSQEVLDGQRGRIDKDQKETPLLEVQAVDLADSITYNAHDVDDAVTLGWLDLTELLQLPIMDECLQAVTNRFGDLRSSTLRRAMVHELTNMQVVDLVETARSVLAECDGCSVEQMQSAGIRLRLSDHVARSKSELESFLFQKLYRHQDLVENRAAAQEKLRSMAEKLGESPELLPQLFHSRISSHGLNRSVADYLAAMTDQFCLRQYEKLIG